MDSDAGPVQRICFDSSVLICSYLRDSILELAAVTKAPFFEPIWAEESLEVVGDLLRAGGDDPDATLEPLRQWNGGHSLVTAEQRGEEPVASGEDGAVLATVLAAEADILVTQHPGEFTSDDIEEFALNAVWSPDTFLAVVFLGRPRDVANVITRLVARYTEPTLTFAMFLTILAQSGADGFKYVITGYLRIEDLEALVHDWRAELGA